MKNYPLIISDNVVVIVKSVICVYIRVYTYMCVIYIFINKSKIYDCSLCLRTCKKTKKKEQQNSVVRGRTSIRRLPVLFWY